MMSNPTARILSRIRPLRQTCSPTLRTAAPTRHSIRHVSSQRSPRRATIPEINEVNPLDPVAVHRAEAAFRARHSRRRNRAAIGCFITMAVPLVILYNLDLEELQKKGAEKTDSSSDVTREFQGRQVVVAPGGEKLQAVDEDGIRAPIELVETGTSSVPVFPKTIELPTAEGDAGAAKADAQTEYTLLGLGIRTVSFLSIQVYVVGLYVETSALPRLQAALIHRVNPTASALIPGEKEQLRTALLDPVDSTAIWEALLRDDELKANMALRIVPTRDTNFAHLRDGLVRGITKRMQEAQAAAAQAKTESEYNDEAFGRAMKDFKTLFNSRGKAGKGTVLLLRRDAKGDVEMLFQATGKGGRMGPLEQLGTVPDERVSRLLWLLYLGGKDVSSEDARKKVVEGCLDLVGRPIGTVETRVV